MRNCRKIVDLIADEKAVGGFRQDEFLRALGGRSIIGGHLPKCRKP
jgi:predicted NodU family carbamoyl transferase